MVLHDSHGMAKEDLRHLSEKLNITDTILARSPEKGGSPFVYAFSCSKQNHLEDISMPMYVDDQGTEYKFYSAATNGKRYMWHPEMIRRLNPFELGVVKMHETYHIVLQHTDPNRCMGKNHKVWNIAVDYVVNSMIEHDFRKAGRISDCQYDPNNHPIWTGNLGRGLPFSELLSSVKEAHKNMKNSKNGKTKKQKNKNNLAKKGPPKPEDLRFYADYSMYGKSAEEIYDAIMEYVKEMEEDLFDMLMQQLGAGTPDDHDQPAEIGRGDLLQEVLDAVMSTKQLAGKVPASIEDHLKKLLEPKLSWQDIVRNTFQAKRQEKGRINDYSRFRRRGIALSRQPSVKPQDQHPLFLPKKKDDYVSGLVLLDTSGSMSPDDMTYGISQLKCLNGRSDILIVCVDAQPYWDKANYIQKMTDLPNINIVGRGGTAFKEFFDDYRTKVGTQWDVLVVLTDGGIWDVDQLKRPHCDTVWVLTNSWEGFKAPFGRSVPFRSY